MIGSSMEDAKLQTVFDSDQQQIGEIYANALVGFGQKSSGTESLLGELRQVVGALDGVPKLKALLESPQVGRSEKTQLLDKVFSGKVSTELLNFLKVVLEKGRFDCVQAISVSAKKIFDEISGRVQATLTTAEPVDDGVRNQIAEKLAAKIGKQVEVNVHVDPSIIGGMVVRVGDTVYDGSVKSQLAQVRAKATKRAADAIRSSLDKFMAS